MHENCNRIDFLQSAVDAHFRSSQEGECSAPIFARVLQADFLAKNCY